MSDGADNGAIPTVGDDHPGPRRSGPALPSIPGYNITHKAGEGGMGTVWRAVQINTGRTVAVKILSQAAFGSERARARFDREVQILAALQHPNIVSIIDRGTTDAGLHYLVMDYVVGLTFDKYLSEVRSRHESTGSPIDTTELLKLFMKICDAVNTAHLRGVVHRDLKPSNIIVDEKGEPHILDFGVARASLMPSTGETPSAVTITGEFIGSLPWASPEQAEGATATIDMRSDVYSLGVILYHILTGQFPYRITGTMREVMDNILKANPTPISEHLGTGTARTAAARSKPRFASVETQLQPIVMKALAKKREDRYQSAGELARDIASFLSGKQIAAPRLRRRSRMVIAAATAVFLVILAVTVWTATRNEPAPPSEKPVAAAGSDLPWDQIVGYLFESNQVVFVFDASQLEMARWNNGKLADISTIDPIQSVLIRGDFNDWTINRADWQMTAVEPRKYVLRKNLAQFRARPEWAFKFVANGDVWVGAPEYAVNKASSGEDAETFNFLLWSLDGQAATARRDFESLRSRIEAAWPGTGSRLIFDAENGHTLGLGYPPEFAGQEQDLEPLRGIPLAALDLGDFTAVHLGPLTDTPTLRKLLLNYPSYVRVFSAVISALQEGDFSLAKAQLDKALSPKCAAPALVSLRKEMLRGIDLMAALQKDAERIPPQASSLSGRHYAVIPLPMTWEMADTFCAKHGAHLVTVTSAQEQREVYGLFPPHIHEVWMGGTDAAQEATWIWSNGEAWTFANWLPGEPNNFEGAEHATTMIVESKWNDQNPARERLFVMEWDR